MIPPDDGSKADTPCHCTNSRRNARFRAEDRTAASGRYEQLSITAIMHSAQLCAFGTPHHHCRLAGSGREHFHAEHNFRAFGKTGRASPAVPRQGVKPCFRRSTECESSPPKRTRRFALHLPTLRTDPMRLHAEVDAELRKHGAASHLKYAQNAAAHTAQSLYWCGFLAYRPSLLVITAHCA